MNNTSGGAGILFAIVLICIISYAGERLEKRVAALEARIVDLEAKAAK